MYNLNNFMGILEEFAPLQLSHKLQEKGMYDNSGLLVKCKNQIKKVLFCLDLTKKAVEFAKKVKADTIVTHHPAIYMPIKSLSIEDTIAAPILLAIKNEINVISMHLNLDVAKNGIDYNLCKGLGGESYKNVQNIDSCCGYGKEFKIEKQSLSDFIKEIKKQFRTNKILCYKAGKEKIETVASFCGSGGSEALEYLKENKLGADLIVTSDAPHHVIKEIIEMNRSLIIIPHYVSEEYGFKAFYQEITQKTKDLEFVYFDDKRFR